MVVEKGKKIKIEYEGSLDSGQVFDSSKGKDPLEYVVGEGKVIPGFESAVMGMEKGEEKKVKIESKDAYGEVREELKRSIPKNSLPKDQAPKEGMIVLLKAPTGEEFPAKICKVTKEEITIDLNHPLAGKKLIFSIKILEKK